MEIACPACGKSNELRTVTACARCGCDLEPLACILAGAAWQLQAAVTALRAKAWAGALEHAQCSWSLRHSLPAAQVACLAALALERTEAALQWRTRALRLSPRGWAEGNAPFR